MLQWICIWVVFFALAFFFGYFCKLLQQVLLLIRNLFGSLKPDRRNLIALSAVCLARFLDSVSFQLYPTPLFLRLLESNSNFTINRVDINFIVKHDLIEWYEFFCMNIYPWYSEKIVLLYLYFYHQVPRLPIRIIGIPFTADFDVKSSGNELRDSYLVSNFFFDDPISITVRAIGMVNYSQPLAHQTRVFELVVSLICFEISFPVAAFALNFRWPLLVSSRSGLLSPTHRTNDFSRIT